MKKKSKVAICIPTASEREKYYEELLDSLGRQTFKDFTIYTVKDVKPIGAAKHTLVNIALENSHKYICMIDDDDLTEPTYLEDLVKKLDGGDVDWAFTWGKLFGDREGYIHSTMQLNPVNERPAQFMARSKVFKINYNPKTEWAEDLELWEKFDEAGYKGAIVEKELYLRRWHNKNLTTAHSRTENSNKFRFHLLGLVHLPVSERYMGCAFTQKIVKMSKMLLSLGYEVYLYGAEGSDTPCTEFIQTHTLKDIRKEWGSGDNRFEIGYDWKNSEFRHDFNAQRTATTMKYYSVCIQEINKRKKPDDFLLISQGDYQKPIFDAVGLDLSCEFGVGYRGSNSKNFRAFESSYLQNFTYGSEHPRGDINGNYYDRVIPNYFDPKDFVFSNKKEDYYLYIGRMIQRKGVWTAIRATQAIGAKLILVGQQDPEIDVKSLPSHCHYLGYADIEKRKGLMAKAIATFTPTTYLEAFAGTHIESMLSGTPPITTNFGVFPETIPNYLNGKIGFRCDTLQDFVDAGKKAKLVDHKFIREYGERFLMDNVKLEFKKWFEDLHQWYLSTDGVTKGWSYLK